MQGTGREGEHHLMRRGSLPLRGRRRRSGGGGGGGGAPPLDLAGREERSDEWGTGAVSVGRERFRGGIGLTRAANPYAAGFQRCILDFTGMNSVWAANRGSDGDPRRDMGFQTKPKGEGAAAQCGGSEWRGRVKDGGLGFR